MVSISGHGASRGSGREREPTDVETLVFPVHTVPGASASRILGVEAGTLKVRVAAPPVRGKANKELVALLAKALGVSKAQVEIVSGHTARRKRVRVHGVRGEAVANLLRTGDDPEKTHE
jgi:uncharacterized protein (TIGR00251 family)